ncbi:hypothetical protein [Ewingella americana]|uniref:Uncharacterized protein n=1 Tax=Ewingella americana TaxID=41202 RepID=A0A502GDJ5_9GAMM|nr:hypothetical protein [Ewingella americana]TPG59934.1 hypothetical protein EAH77_15315 [Ewingella americana]
MSALIKKKASVGLRVRHEMVRRRAPIVRARRMSATMVPVKLNPQILYVDVTAEQLQNSVKVAEEYKARRRESGLGFGEPTFVEA